MMAKPFDTITKQLVEMHPFDWLTFLGIEADTVEVINANRTYSLEADRVLKITSPEPLMLHLEFQVAYEPMGLRMLRYSIALYWAEMIPVQSVLVLLRPAADGPHLDGKFQLAKPDGEGYLWFEYQVVRIWQIPAEQFMQGGLGLLPFATIAADVTQANVGSVVRRIEERLSRESVTDSEAADLLLSSFILMGTRFDKSLIERLKQEVVKMRESVAYMMILDEGRAEGLSEGINRGRSEGLTQGRYAEARSLILRLGSKRFGSPSERVQSLLDTIGETEELEEVAERLMDVESWEELLPPQA